MFTVKIRDHIGTYNLDNIVQVVPVSRDIWSIMYADYETEEVQGELVEIIAEGY